MSSWKKGVVSAIGVWVAAEVAYVVYCNVTKKQKKKLTKSEDNNTLINVISIEAPSDKTNLSEIKDLLQKHFPPNKDETCEIWNTVMFFPDYKMREPDSLTRKLIWYLNQSEKAVKVCMYVLRCKILEKALYEISEKKNVLVMVVAGNGGCLRSLRAHGIMAREKPTIMNSAFDKSIFVDLLHNKFIILDDVAVMAGSLNWTEPGVTENRENVVVTNNQATVAMYVERFESLWNLSEPEPYAGRRGRRQKKTKKEDIGDTGINRTIINC